VELSAIALTGLDRAQARFEQSARSVTAATAPPTDSATADTVDLTTASVNLLAAKQDFAVNLKVLQTADRLDRSTLDILA
jgi:hypothetical protein